MVEDIITGLSRIKWLFVIARNSTFVYKDKAIDVKQVGRELGVRYLLEGSVRKAGTQVRVTGQLIDTASATHVWAQRYDRAFDDVFALQDELTMSVIAAIEPTLRQAEIERAKRKRPDSLDAYDLYLRALPLVFTAMPEFSDQALPLLRRRLRSSPITPWRTPTSHGAMRVAICAVACMTTPGLLGYAMPASRSRPAATMPPLSRWRALSSGFSNGTIRALSMPSTGRWR